MRKEWNIETVNITPAALQKQEEDLPVTKMGRIRHFLKKNRLRIFLGVLCAYLVFTFHYSGGRYF